MDFSLDALYHQVSLRKVEHGRHVVGMDLASVWRYARDYAVTNSRSRPAEPNASRALLRAFARFNLALEELTTAATRVGINTANLPPPPTSTSPTTATPLSPQPVLLGPAQVSDSPLVPYPSLNGNMKLPVGTKMVGS